MLQDGWQKVVRAARLVSVAAENISDINSLNLDIGTERQHSNWDAFKATVFGRYYSGGSTCHVYA